MNPWVTKGIAKFSKKKQRLYEKYLKKRNPEYGKVYKNYKSFFESIKKKSKKLYYYEKLLKLQGNAKQTWKVMKEITGKTELLHTSHIPQIINVNRINLFDKVKTANEFNQFFSNIGIELASKIPTAKITFETCVENVNSTMESNLLTINELKDAFFSLKINKSPGYDETSFNFVKKCFGELYDHLKFIFELSLEKVIFPDDLKIARNTSVFKVGDWSKLGNYRPILVLPCFSKILERIIYNRVYKYLLENKILYPK